MIVDKEVGVAANGREVPSLAEWERLATRRETAMRCLEALVAKYGSPLAMNLEVETFLHEVPSNGDDDCARKHRSETIDRYVSRCHLNRCRMATEAVLMADALLDALANESGGV